MTRGVYQCVFGVLTVRYIGKWVPIVKDVQTIFVYIFFEKKKIEKVIFAVKLLRKEGPLNKKMYHLYCTFLFLLFKML